MGRERLQRHAEHEPGAADRRDQLRRERRPEQQLLHALLAAEDARSRLRTPVPQPRLRRERRDDGRPLRGDPPAQVVPAPPTRFRPRA